MEEVKQTSLLTCLKSKAQNPNPNVLLPQENKTKQSPKATRGRQKVEIKEIKEESKRQVTFSKRRRGLFKKSAELCVLTGAKIAVITFSRCGRVYRFGQVDTLIEKYLRKIPVKLEVFSGDDVAEEGGGAWWDRPVESVPEEELGDYEAALRGLRDSLGKRIWEMGNENRMAEIVQAQVNQTAVNNLLEWKPMEGGGGQSLGNLTAGINRSCLGHHG